MKSSLSFGGEAGLPHYRIQWFAPIFITGETNQDFNVFPVLLQRLSSDLDLAGHSNDLVINPMLPWGGMEGMAYWKIEFMMNLNCSS